mmetsp:Transcript_23647/g.42790  ORF Transcript_23647/g.42790 Transcript_23647/m.42790 type:complete len:310 (-) Transcript_23647:339-1268(-)
MDVGIEIVCCHGKVHVDDMLHAINIQPSRRNIRGHQNTTLPRSELRKRGLPLRLRTIPVNLHGLDRIEPHIRPLRTPLRQLLLQPRRRLLLLDEHQRPPFRTVPHRLHDQLQLVPLVRRGLAKLLRDAVRRRPDPAHRDPRVALPQELARQKLDLVGERRREHGGDAAILGSHVGAKDELADLRFEAHVEHAIGLVQDEVCHGGERDEVPIDEVRESSGRGHDDGGLVSRGCECQLAELIPLAGASVDGHGLQCGIVEAQLFRFHFDLRCEFSGRREDDALRFDGTFHCSVVANVVSAAFRIGIVSSGQ